MALHPMNAFLLFGEELKKHRQAKQISLVQVSAATRINVKFLEAIEVGRFSVLPEPYVRAFVREYTQAVELNTEEILLKYDEAVKQTRPSPAPQPVPLPQEIRPSSGARNHQLNVQLAQLAQRNIIPLLAVGAILIIVLFLSNSGSSDTQSDKPAEVSFDRVVKESEATPVNNQPASRTTAPLVVAKSDSLRLEMTSIDSLWILIEIDGKRKVEYLFPPKYRRTWTAKDQFAITMGNAGGATFRLNDKEIGALGKRGAVVRNAVITAETPTKL